MLKIGTFARRASVSIKTLRFYDRAGVFRPVHVDPSSGYRYYESGQLDTLHELRLLRQLGLSIADLRCWVHSEAHEARLGLLQSLREQVQRRLAGEQARLRDLDEWIALGTIHKLPRLRSIPPIPALTLREKVRQASPAVYRMFETLERKVARDSARAAREPFLLVHSGGYREKTLEVEACVPLIPEAVTTLGGRIVEGASRAASLEFSGPYDRAPGSFIAIEKWLGSRGAQAIGPLRETYLRFGADQRGYELPRRFLAVSAADYRTVLQVPIARS